MTSKLFVLLFLVTEPLLFVGVCGFGGSRGRLLEMDSFDRARTTPFPATKFCHREFSLSIKLLRHGHFCRHQDLSRQRIVHDLIFCGDKSRRCRQWDSVVVGFLWTRQKVHHQTTRETKKTHDNRISMVGFSAVISPSSPSIDLDHPQKPPKTRTPLKIQIQKWPCD